MWLHGRKSGQWPFDFGAVILSYSPKPELPRVRGCRCTKMAATASNIPQAAININLRKGNVCPLSPSKVVPQWATQFYGSSGTAMESEPHARSQSLHRAQDLMDLPTTTPPPTPHLPVCFRLVQRTAEWQNTSHWQWAASHWQWPSAPSALVLGRC